MTCSISDAWIYGMINKLIFIRSAYLYKKYIPFSIINVEKFCKDKELEACAVKLYFLSYKICVVNVYRSPIGNFQYFINELDNIINKIYKSGDQLIICGDL